MRPTTRRPDDPRALRWTLAAALLAGCQGERLGGADLVAMAFGAALVAAPLAVGATVGARLRDALGGKAPRVRHAALAAGLAAIALLAAVVVRRFTDVGAWDIFGAAACLAAGLAAGMLWTPGPAGRRGALVAAVATALCLLVSEGAVRAVMPPAPHYPPPREARLMLPVMNRDEACPALYPDRSQIIAERTQGLLDRPVRVLHIGDSMTAGTGSSREQAFPAVLSSMQPGVAHINAGVVGLSPDQEYLTTLAWTARLPVQLVVLHLFTANDIPEIGRPSLCCHLDSVLVETAHGVAPRCPTPDWAMPFAWHVSSSPPPYPMRVFANASSLAGYATSAFARVSRDALPDARLDIIERPPYTARWRVFTRVIAQLRDALRARNIPLLVVVIPSRYTMERSLGRTPIGVDIWGSLEAGMEARLQMLSIVREAGVDVIDPWETLVEAVRTTDPAQLFAHDCPGDFHPSPAGQAIYARWLAPQITARLAAQGHAP